MKQFHALFSIIVLSLSLTACDFGSSSSNSNSTTATPNVWMLGQAAPDNNIGNTNDLYLNTTSSDIYTKQNGAWAFAGNIRGQVGVKGNQGDKGNQWYTGASNPDPTVSLGLEGDFYVNTVTSDVFQKQNNLWVVVFNVKGVKGDKGETGTSGRNGVVWYTGTVSPPPASLSVNVNDFYLNTQSGELYRKDATGWTGPVTVIKGTNGKDGTNGVNGTNGTSGVNGATWITGTGTPVAGAGNVGDLYFEVLTGSVYQKNLSGWGNSIAVLKGNTGLTGAAGANGTNGTAWCASATITDPNTQIVPGCPNDGAGNLGDYFLNTETGEVFNKTTGSTWVKTFTMAVKAAVDSYVASSLATLSQSIRNSVTVPGTVISYAGDTCPGGYLAADGTSYPIDSYSSLASALVSSSNGKFIWGGADSKHFYVPDLRGQFLRGVDPTAVVDQNASTRTNYAGATVGGVVGSYQADQMQGHKHSISDPGHSHLTALNYGAGASYNGWPSAQGYLGINGTGAQSNNGAGYTSSVATNIAVQGPSFDGISGSPRVGIETRPKNMAVLYCIKY
jgi:hypothetical protein